MKKVQTFTTKHLYYLLATGLLLTLIATAPFLMEADVTKTDGPSCPPSDRDCDGVPNRCPATGCSGPDVMVLDLDDNDNTIGCMRGCATGGF